MRGFGVNCFSGRRVAFSRHTQNKNTGAFRGKVKFLSILSRDNAHRAQLIYFSRPRFPFIGALFPIPKIPGKRGWFVLFVWDPPIKKSKRRKV